MRTTHRSNHLDRLYFSQDSWARRRERWVGRADRQGSFARGNDEIVQEAVADEESGLRVVLNLGVHALLRLLPDGRYVNLYERPVIGGSPRRPSPSRRQVDHLFGLVGRDTYFAAVALGGAGVRFYGEYCLVLHLDEIDDDPQIVDRDSYDVLLPPLAEQSDKHAVVAAITGRWQRDRHDIVALKVLPEITHLRNLVTTGTVSELVLKDQEFIEVHLRPGKSGSDERGGFGRKQVLEVRQSPDEVAVAARIVERERAGEVLPAVDDEWMLRRESAERVLARAGVPVRVVTTHGRGYQWK
ncbi:hypothetical protein [Aquipuribacter nitratireducens]|uniref:Uncharacterized protein n=1 Tax=Aquipuribacter nitratireducens TaxID=650104 RepID=A0ABW0GI48_9MICO